MYFYKEYFHRDKFSFLDIHDFRWENKYFLFYKIIISARETYKKYLHDNQKTLSFGKNLKKYILLNKDILRLYNLSHINFNDIKPRYYNVWRKKILYLVFFCFFYINIIYTKICAIK